MNENESKPKEVSWSQPVEGLQVRLELPSGLHFQGDTIFAKIWFRNQSDKPIRIYLLRNTFFRATQSDLRIRDKKSGQIISSQPEPHPHGMQVTEDEFHLIEPGKTMSFPQRLDFNAEKFKSPGEYLVEWQYQNQIDIWKGGAQTLDGPTKELFGGQPIPHIWKGKIGDSQTIMLRATDEPTIRTIELKLTQNKPVSLSNGIQLKLLNTLYAHMSGPITNESLASIEMTYQGKKENASFAKEHPRGETTVYTWIPHVSLQLEYVDAYHQPSTAGLKILTDDKSLRVSK